MFPCGFIVTFFLCCSLYYRYLHHISLYFLSVSSFMLWNWGTGIVAKAVLLEFPRHV